MFADQRRWPRKKVNAVCFLYTSDGSAIGACRVKDISAGGAQLVHSFSQAIPEEFLVSFSRNGKVRRRCRIAWSNAKHIGVCFLPDADALSA
jgi:hypothetical protein